MRASITFAAGKRSVKSLPDFGMWMTIDDFQIDGIKESSAVFNCLGSRFVR